MQSEFRGGPARALRGAGAVLIAAAILEVPVMAHHPSGRTPDVAQTIEQLRTMATLSAWVHGVLITLMLIGFYALTEFSLWRGLRRPPIRAGLIAYAVGVFAMIGAASISGFVTAHVAALVPSTNEADLRVAGQILVLCGVLNRAMASLGAVAMSAGIAAWSLDLLSGARFTRAMGALGILIGLMSAAALVFGPLRLDVHGMLLIVVLQSIWTVGVGFLLLKAGSG
jgi:hypothetical protein